MARDDQRMHGGNTPGMVPGRGHERQEDPVRLDTREPGTGTPDLTGDAAVPPGRAVSSTEERTQDSALGGHTATRSGTARTPADEKA